MNYFQAEIWVWLPAAKNCSPNNVSLSYRCYFVIFVLLLWRNVLKMRIRLNSLWNDIFNCNLVATRWQSYSTHKHTNNTDNDIKQKIHRTTQKYTEQHKYLEECWPCPVFAGFILAFALQLRKEHGKTSVRVAIHKHTMRIPSRRSQKPRGLRSRSAAACLLRSWVRNPPGAWNFVCCDCCVLWGKGLCDELITRPEESYRMLGVVVCDLETSTMRRPWTTLGCSATAKK